jgi:hypothetical protein
MTDMQSPADSLMLIDYGGHRFHVEAAQGFHVYRVECLSRRHRSWRTFFVEMTIPCAGQTTASSLDWLMTFIQRHAETLVTPRR